MCATEPCGSPENWNCANYDSGVYICKCAPGWLTPEFSKNQRNLFSGYTGSKCDTVIQSCDASGPCFNYDKCTVNGTDFECDCKDKYKGDRCESK